MILDNLYEVKYMKQMTKEELIEYFIEQLGDNKILGQVMTIEQIREKLNAVIKDVSYADDIKIFDASWKLQQDGTGIVNFDINKIAKDQERRIIVHELLHALSKRKKKVDCKYLPHIIGRMEK